MSAVDQQDNKMAYLLLESEQLRQWSRLRQHLLLKFKALIFQFYRRSEFWGEKCLHDQSESPYALSRDLRIFPWPVDTLWTNLQSKEEVLFPFYKKEGYMTEESSAQLKNTQAWLGRGELNLSFLWR